jgi:hypothetical protein
VSLLLPNRRGKEGCNSSKAKDDKNKDEKKDMGRK